MRGNTGHRATHPERDLDRLCGPSANTGRTLGNVTAVVPEGRRLLRIEARNAETPIERKPPWIKIRAKMGPEFSHLRGLVQREGLHTVCQEAGCPNIYECWADHTATFMILGDRCTRACGFCLVDTRKPFAPDPGEPGRVADAVAHLGLEHVVVTSVARDDVADGGAAAFAATIDAIRRRAPGTGVEVSSPTARATPTRST